MDVKELQQRAATLRSRTAEGSITPEDVGGLFVDIITLIGEQGKATGTADVQLSALDAMITTPNEAMAAMADGTRYVVRNRGVVVGQLFLIGDTMSHGSTQVFTTNLLLLPNGTFGEDHTHGDVFTYHRTWAIRVAGGLTEVGKWSAWAVATGNPESVTTLTTEEDV